MGETKKLATGEENEQMSGLSAALPSIGQAMLPKQDSYCSVTSRDVLLESGTSESDTVGKGGGNKLKKRLNRANSQKTFDGHKTKKEPYHTGNSNKKWLAGSRHNMETRCILIMNIINMVCIIIFVVLNQRNSDLARPAHSESTCPRLWIGYEGVCYYFSKKKQNWTSSQNFCFSYNASLARIHNEEKDFLMRLKGKDIYWIGLRKAQDQTWRWTDGEITTLEVTGNGGNCAYLNNDAEASSSGCHIELPWICCKSAAYKYHKSNGELGPGTEI